MIRNATDSTFEDVVLLNPRPVLVVFWEDQCELCRNVSANLHQLGRKYAGSVDVVAVDIGSNHAVAASYSIAAVPTIAYFGPGEEPLSVVGAWTSQELESVFGLGAQSRSSLVRSPQTPTSGPSSGCPCSA